MAKKVGNRQHKKTTVDGVEFDSILESRFYTYLNKKIEEGVIVGFKMQVPYVLVDACDTVIGKQRQIGYVADFVVTMSDGTTIVVDTKGFCDAVSKLKRKLFLARYNLPLYYICQNVKWLGAGTWAEIDIAQKIAKRGKVLSDFKFNGLFYY